MTRPENWAFAPDHEDLYEVSDQGRARNTRTGHILSSHPNDTGHLLVTLFKGGTRKTYQLHRLILRAFRGPSELQGLHWDDDPSNNWIENLYWGTQSQNVFDSVRNGTHHAARKTRCKNDHDLTGANLAIRRSGKRACRRCVADRQAQRRKDGKA